jgi:DNA repair protein RecN (Recombination protein N)
MLTRLTIKNYALIKQLEMSPSAQLNVITGETGAGKSIMLGAVGLLLGHRADTKVLWNVSEKCVTEGVFDISSYSMKPLFEKENLDYEKFTVIRREINPAGKSRAFINDTPVTLETLRSFGNLLMDVHSQHETLELGNRSFQLQLLDTFASNHKLKEVYTGAWKEFTKARSDYDRLFREGEALRQESDFVKFQLDELIKADLRENEQEELESDLKIKEHAEDIKVRFNDAIARLGGTEMAVTALLTDVKNKLSTIAGYAPAYTQLFQRIESARIELDDILNEIEAEESKIDFDPKGTEAVKERLSLIYQLLQKNRFTNITELLQLQETLQQKSAKTNNLGESLTDANRHLEQTTVELQKKSADLRKSREKVMVSLCKKIVELLKELGIPEARLKMELEIVQPGPLGSDSVELLFSANKGIEPRPLAQVASGGEFARLMFCVKYVMAEKTSMPTLILDEIDNGVSGEVAIQLGKMMKVMAQNHQIIAISHLPQIAAQGDTHYFVYKNNSADKTVSEIRQLTGEERVSEIAKMIGGAKPSVLALENARELMTRYT